MWCETPSRVHLAVRLARRTKAPLSVIARRAEQVLAGDGRRYWEHARTRLAEGLHEYGIVEHQARMESWPRNQRSSGARTAQA